MSEGKYELRGYKFKLFLQGIEIPFKSINVSHTDSSSFNINVPPFIETTELEPNTYGVVVYKNKKMDNEWHVLCEGIYHGPGYTKTANSRNSTLMFKDVKWFFENAKLFDIFSVSKPFGPTEAIFFGDTRYSEDLQEEFSAEKAEKMAGNHQFKIRAHFLNEFSDDSDTPVTDSLNWLLDNMVENNEFSKKHAENLNLNANRFKIIENANTSDIFQQSVLTEIYGGVLENANPLTSINDLIYSLAQIIQYDITPIPGFLSNKMEAYTFKPKMELVTPPACNVIFPDEFTSLNFRKNFGNIPSRYRLVDQLIGSTSYGYYAPKQIEEAFEKRKEGEGGDRGYLTDEEKLKGVIPYQSSLPFSQTLSMGFEEQKLKDHIKFKSLFTNYMYYEKKYRSVPLNLEVAFKPGLLPGFPILILDKEIPLIGYLQGVTHNIDMNQGYGFSTLTVSHVRPATKRVPILAGWYAKNQFMPSKISDNVYDDLGTKSCFSKVSDPKVEDDMVDFYPAVKELLEEYKSHPDRLALQKSFKRDLPVFHDESGETSDTVLNELGLEWDRDQEKLKGDSLTGIGLNIEHEMRDENGEVTSSEKDVGQARRDKVQKLKDRMNESGIARRRFSKKERGEE